MIRLYSFITLAVILLNPLATSSAQAAAPFCTEASGIAPQCHYYDAISCRKEAAIIGGICRVNEEEVALPEGYGNYCLVYSNTLAECLYLDLNSCDQEAVRKNGVCVRNFTKPEPLPSFEFTTPDAYQSF